MQQDFPFLEIRQSGLILSLELFVLKDCKESRKTGFACSIGPQCDCMALRVLTARNKTLHSWKFGKAGLILSLELLVFNDCKESRKTGFACSIGPQCDCMALRVLTTCNKILPSQKQFKRTNYVDHLCSSQRHGKPASMTVSKCHPQSSARPCDYESPPWPLLSHDMTFDSTSRCIVVSFGEHRS